MTELDMEGLITAKHHTQANAINNPKYELFMQHAASQFDNVQEQLDNVTVAMSIHTQARQPGSPPPS